MISGPQRKATVFFGSNRASGRRVVTTPTSPYQLATRRVDRRLEAEVGARAPRLDLVVVDEVLRGPGAVDDLDTTVSVAVAKQLVEEGPKRGETEAASDDHHVAPVGLLEGPPDAVGSADPDDRARACVTQGTG